MTNGLRQEVIDRFWARVEKSPNGGCWLWTAAKLKEGYGVCWDGKATQRAHRMAWFLTKGDWPAACLCHKCDNPQCVNPSHMFVGTRAENLADMRRKGRGSAPPKNHGKGEDHCYVKLTEKQVVNILRRVAGGEMKRKLAAEHGVSESNIHAICSGRSWTHIDRESVLKT